MTSDEGLDAYGAVTWGQFFVYQGFNARIGWMHTSSGVDNIDEYAETVVDKGGTLLLQVRRRERPIEDEHDRRALQDGHGHGEEDVHRLPHRPRPGRPRSRRQVDHVRLMQDPVHALIQSYSRTKAHDYKSFRKWMELHTNSSNNTIFADADGDIAYFHSNFIPKRDPKFDWLKPVDGSDPATEWHGVLGIDETPNLLEPEGRLALQQQQLAVVGGRPRQPEARGLSGLRGSRHGGIAARPARAARAAGQARTSRPTR